MYVNFHSNSTFLDSDFEDSSIVKVSVNHDNIAKSFERIIKKPNSKGSLQWEKHIGIYGFKKETLSKICELSMTQLEKQENLEQLRWLENNFKIKCIRTTETSYSINTKEDIDMLNNENIL